MFEMRDSVVSKAARLVRWGLVVLLGLVVACKARCSFSDYASDATSISMGDCGLTTVNTAELTRFTNLQYLELSSNQLTTFPDLSPVGTTLKTLYLGDNEITDISDDMLIDLTALELLHLGKNRLTTFPNVSASGSTLKILCLYDNEITDISDDVFIHLTALEILFLYRNPNLTHFPHPVHGLRTIRHLWIQDTTISHLPPILLENIADLTLDIERSVDVCLCENAWLKQEGPNMAVFSYDDAECDGHPWSSMSTQDMLTKCAHQRTQETKQFARAKAVPPKMSLSPFLLHSFAHNSNKIKCTEICMDTPGCVSFYWRRPQTGSGDCVIIAPGNSIGVSIVPEGNLPVWMYFALT